MKKDNLKNNFIGKLKNEFKLQLLVCVILSLVSVFIIIVFNKLLDDHKYRQYTLVDDGNLINSIEDIIVENKDLIVSGYAFILCKNSDDNKISLILRNVDNIDEELWLATKQESRQDVNIYFEGDYNYINSGFTAIIPKDKLKKEVTYEIIINIDYSELKDENKEENIRKTVTSRRYILNNELYSYNPKNNNLLSVDIGSDILREVITNGNQCFFNENEGMYVYQHQGKLYWIADKNFKFNENSNTYIIYHLYTSQLNKLPEYRIQYQFDNLDFIFEEYEYTDEYTGSYRVAIRDIPMDYPIAFINSGVYDLQSQEIIWKRSFHLDNLIDK